MEIKHYDGITLEHIVSNIFSSDRGSMGGIVNSGTFEHNPLLASYLIIARLYKNSKIQDKYIEEFINKWETVFQFPNENEEYTFKEYTDELKDLIKILKNK